MQRVHVAVVTLALLALANASSAQTGRATGSVVDPSGKGIKGATIRATNRDASPSELTSTTDDKGRFGMIGLRAGVWTFTAEAPGYEPATGTAPIRAATLGPPLRFVIQRTPEPIPNALSKDITEQLSAANTLRSQGRYEQAISAYQSIQARNPTLTTLNVVMADAFRQQADREQNQASRQALYTRAIAAYTEAMKADTSERVRLELGLTQVSAGRVDDAVKTFQDLVASMPNSVAAKDAAAKLAELRR